MRLDLHLHSTASDGSLPPGRVLEAASRARLDVVALTDHDTAAGVRSAAELGTRLRVQLVAGVEISSTLEGREFHFLGYFVDPAAPALLRHEERAREGRAERMRGMVARLRQAGWEVEFEEVVEAAGKDAGALARPHLARALVSRGHVSSVAEAFDVLIGDEHPAFLPTDLLRPREAIALILEAGGVPVWAHPPRDRVEALLPRLVRAGLRGLEVYRPRHDRAYVLQLEGLARIWGLLRSGGSDWHGPERGGPELGEFHVTADEVAELLEAGGI